MKVERVSSTVFRVTNCTDMDAVVVHGDHGDGAPPARDVLRPGEEWEFSGPLEVRFGPFLPEGEPAKAKVVHVMNEPSTPTMFKAIRRGWQVMEQRAQGRAMTLVDFNAGVMEFFMTLGGKSDDAPFKPTIVPKDDA